MAHEICNWRRFQQICSVKFLNNMDLEEDGPRETAVRHLGPVLAHRLAILGSKNRRTSPISDVRQLEPPRSQPRRGGRQNNKATLKDRPFVTGVNPIERPNTKKH